VKYSLFVFLSTVVVNSYPSAAIVSIVILSPYLCAPFHDTESIVSSCDTVRLNEALSYLYVTDALPSANTWIVVAVGVTYHMKSFNVGNVSLSVSHVCVSLSLNTYTPSLSSDSNS
jgi:hypothetical protein